MLAEAARGHLSRVHIESPGRGLHTHAAHGVHGLERREGDLRKGERGERSKAHRLEFLEIDEPVPIRIHAFDHLQGGGGRKGEAGAGPTSLI